MFFRSSKVSDEGLLIEDVLPGSIAAELEIVPGDRLLMVNGMPLRDIIDYNFHGADDELLFLVKKGDGELWELEFDRVDGEPLGLIFATPVPDSCGNNCIFCFVHQLPRGLRKPLYVKDEDYRLSFLYGNYVTLANITAAEIERIIEQRLSPLYISVHASDPALRERLLGRSKLVPILTTMSRLARAGIRMHTQVVLCPGINDSTFLEQTVDDLAALHPQVASLAVVPLGLTRHRRGLPQLEPVTTVYAANFLREWLPRQQALHAKLNDDFLFFADEFFIKGGVAFPPLDAYGDLPQLENGVGMIPLFLEEAADVLAEVKRLPAGRVTVVTGESPYPWVARFLAGYGDKTGVACSPVAVPNRFFGDQVTVTGLLSGQDIIAALAGRDLGDLVLLPDVMLKEGEGLFLDELTPADLAKVLCCRVEVFRADPEGFHEVLTAALDAAAKEEGGR